MCETIDETIFRLQQQKKISALQTSEYHTKLLLQILEQLEILNSRVAFVEDILAIRKEQ